MLVVHCGLMVVLLEIAPSTQDRSVAWAGAVPPPDIGSVMVMPATEGLPLMALVGVPMVTTMSSMYSLATASARRLKSILADVSPELMTTLLLERL